MRWGGCEVHETTAVEVSRAALRPGCDGTRAMWKWERARARCRSAQRPKHASRAARHSPPSSAGIAAKCNLAHALHGRVCSCSAWSAPAAASLRHFLPRCGLKVLVLDYAHSAHGCTTPRSRPSPCNAQVQIKLLPGSLTRCALVWEMGGSARAWPDVSRRAKQERSGWASFAPSPYTIGWWRGQTLGRALCMA